MEYLLDHGADINASTHFNETALFWAAVKEHVQAVELLLSRNADTTIRNNKGQTASDVAKEANLEEMVKLLSKT